MKRTAISVVLLLAIGACGSASEERDAASPSPTLTTNATATAISSDGELVASGQVNLPFGANGSVEMSREGSECVATGIYYAVDSRAKVHVVDGEGAVSGTGGLGPGKLLEDEETGEPVGCSWEFKVPVEQGGRVYYVQVAKWRTENITEMRLGTSPIVLVPSRSTMSDTEVPEASSSPSTKPDVSSSAKATASPVPELSPEQQLEETYKTRYEEAGMEAIGGVGSASTLAQRQCDTIALVEAENADRVPFSMAAIANLDPIGIEVFCPQFSSFLEIVSHGFADGARTVGTDIAPGTYRTAPGVSDCYWERTTGNGGIIANEFVSFAPEGVVVTVRDAEGFVTSRCGGWLPAG